MTGRVRLRRWAGTAWQYAEGDLASGAVTPMPMARSLWDSLRSRPEHGWYARLGADVVGVGVCRSRVLFLSPGAVYDVTEGAKAELRRGPEESTLTVASDEGKYVVTYVPPPPPAAARIDPTFSETEEDRDFGVWVSALINVPERLAVLQEHFRSPVDV